MLRDLLLIAVSGLMSGTLTALAFTCWRRRLRGHPVSWVAIVRLADHQVIGRGDTTEEAYSDLRARLRFEDEWRLR